MNIIKLLSLAIVSLAFCSCNTLIGIGRDIKQVGNTVGGGLENKGHGQSWKGETTSGTQAPATPAQ